MAVKRGSQRPTWMHHDPHSPLAGNEAIELYHESGRRLDPWQQLCVRGFLAENPDTTPVHLETGVLVSRQNGKGEIIECAELAWMFLPGINPVDLIMHSAHKFETSLKAFKRLTKTIESVPDWDAQIARLSTTHGQEGIELRNGTTIEYRTRSGTGGGGRGFTGTKLIFDEAMYLDVEDMADLMPTLTTNPNAQLGYFGSAGDKTFLSASAQWAQLRRDGLAKKEGLAFYAWEAPFNIGEDGGPSLNDRKWWYKTNPGLGIRITERFLLAEKGRLGTKWKRERLGVGDYPTDEGWMLFSADKWTALLDPGSSIPGEPCLAIDIAPDRSRASVAVCGFNEDGMYHVEVIKQGPGVRWIPDYIKHTVDRRRERGLEFCAIVVAQNGQSRGLIRELEDRYLEPYAATSQEVSEWCGEFFTAVDEALSIRHGGQEWMSQALAGAVKKEIGERFVWSRKEATADLTPLYAATLALGGLLVHGVRDDSPLVASA